MSATIVDDDGDNGGSKWNELLEALARITAPAGIKKIAFSEIRIGKRLGAGEAARVFRATWRGDPVAVKLFPRETDGALVGDDDALAEFEREMSAMARLSVASPRLVRLLGYCPDPLCFVTELMPQGLFWLLHSAAGVRLGWDVRLQIAEDIANGLAFLHAEGVVHRDVKSFNVLLDEHLHAKLADFGIAKVISTIATMTSTDKRFEVSPQWRAPETFDSRYSPKSDIFSFGVVMWELLTREIPHEDVSGA
jgi:serine/threonine protein kinase